MSKSLFKTLPFFMLAVCSMLFFSFCQKEKFTDSPEDRLSFSTDTLRFDTVFTSLGSATRFFKIYNPHSRSIRISRIYLERGAQSKFNLNIDGLPGDDQTGHEIAPRDSLYVFAEVTINPDQPTSISPFVVSENLVIESNGNRQTVVLEAFGQNANYLPSRFYADSITGYACGGGEWLWNDPKPYVIYGVVIIDDCTVRIPAGTRVHVHGGLSKLVQNNETVIYNDGFLAFRGNGKLIVEGTTDRPVIFEGDRLEPEFSAVPGQWTGIWLQAGTRGHRIENCIIRNSIIGVRVDSAAELTLKNTQIYNTTSSGLIGIHATISAENCLFYRNPGFCVQLEYGGDYQFNYCTAANFGVNGESLKLGNALCLDEFCQNYRLNKLHARFKNCIFFGSRADAITLFDRDRSANALDYQLENCIVRVRDLLDPKLFPNFFDNCQPCLNLKATDTIFINPSKNEFRLDTLRSRANRYAVPLAGIDRDLDGKLRDATMPDAGCFENEF